VEVDPDGDQQHKDRGDAAWMTPKTTPHSTGARIERHSSGRAAHRER
jgi:hypothetical protein